MAEQKENLFDIDLDQLHIEWARQPRQYEKWATKLADAKMELDMAKSRFDVVEAELFKAITLDPVSYDIPKATVEMVKMIVRLQSEYQEADKEVIEAKHDVGIIQAKVDALDHKKYALQDEVKLALSSYFSSPTLPEGEGRKAKEYLDDKREEGIASRPKKKREEL